MAIKRSTVKSKGSHYRSILKVNETKVRVKSKNFYNVTVIQCSFYSSKNGKIWSGTSIFTIDYNEKCFL